MPYPIDQPFLDSVLQECIYSLGCGAGMPVGGTALDSIRAKAAGPDDQNPGFTRALFGDLPGTNPRPQARWTAIRFYVLAFSEEIGRLAAARARARGAVIIDLTLDLKPACDDVLKGNLTGKLSDYCPVL